MNIERASVIRLAEGEVSIRPGLSKRKGDVNECFTRLDPNERFSSIPFTCSSRYIDESRMP